jgi:Phosphotransferase enzyme family
VTSGEETPALACSQRLIQPEGSPNYAIVFRVWNLRRARDRETPAGDFRLEMGRSAGRFRVGADDQAATGRHDVLQEVRQQLRPEWRWHVLQLDAEALGTRSDWVITHGEPYGPNLVETDDGRIVLVDWDSALLAPRERDLWEIPSEAHPMRTYVEMTGRVPDPARLRLYRARYHLAQTGIYIHQFRQPHTGDLNDAEAWSNFLFHVPSQTNWPELSA